MEGHWNERNIYAISEQTITKGLKNVVMQYRTLKNTCKKNESNHLKENVTNLMVHWKNFSIPSVEMKEKNVRKNLWHCYAN